MKQFRPNVTVYFISNNTYVIRGTVMSVSGGRYVVAYEGMTTEGTAAIRLPCSRLFALEEEAEAHLPEQVRERIRAEEEQKAAETGFRAPGWH